MPKNKTNLRISYFQKSYQVCYHYLTLVRFLGITFLGMWMRGGVGILDFRNQTPHTIYVAHLDKPKCTSQIPLSKDKI
jgi:hypothetical protein